MKQDKDCYCCADKANVEHKQTIKVNFCDKHTILDFYIKQVNDAMYGKVQR